MDLLEESEIKIILKQCGLTKVNSLNWHIKNYSDEIMGYLGEHLSLIVNFESNCKFESIKFFVKCLPRFDKWKADFLRETTFFDKEYVMLNDLFKQFPEFNGLKRCRPTALLVKKGVFVFEDVTELGYEVPCQHNTLGWDELIATVATLARFHSQSYIFEERKSKALGRQYRIWEEYSEYLKDPSQVQPWRDAGIRAVIDVLKVFSRYKTKENFSLIVEKEIPQLYSRAGMMMKPSSKYRNVVVHRDIWSNNIFLKHYPDGNIHALIVDFQTVVYAAPMIDLASLIYFNTSVSFREKNIEKIIDVYYDVLSKELSIAGIYVCSIIDKASIIESYKESIVFGLTQAALIVPIVAFDEKLKLNIFSDSDKSYKFNIVSRSQVFLDSAKVDETYRRRICDLFDELLDKLVLC